MWGLIRSAQNEHPGRFTLLDTDDNTNSDTLTTALTLQPAKTNWPYAATPSTSPA
ncbi:putative type I polyketide synthase [Mycobacterium ulcerans str. Harvey]|uniref:Type I polyketide synthase n=1 Tax=Mycobacterium ulcerans str. Harvey TaxID=1299332 RepID=A0ABP3A0Y8_MYCUL|nr:putative type I polyketide synthase [Mycobacterium ulcerans str. Harvey]